MRRSRTAMYYNCYYYCINYAEERRKVKADNGDVPGRTDGPRTKHTGTRRTKTDCHHRTASSRNMENYIIIIIILLCCRDGENREDFVARRSEQLI